MMPLVGIVSLTATVALAAASPQDRYAPPDPYEMNIRSLREAVRMPPAGGRSSGLLALIELEDPDLRPVFQSLVQRQDRPVMQADAVVGIATVDPKRTVDPFVLRQVSNVALRSEILKTLIGRGLLRPSEIDQILRWPDELLPEDRLFLVATLEREGAPWESSELATMLTSEVAEFRALAALLLLERGDSTAWDEFRPLIAEMPPSDRNALLSTLAPAIRAYRLEAAATQLLRIASDRSVDANVRAAIIGSSLELAPAAGLRALRQEVAEDRSTLNLSRYALLLLVTAEREGIDPEAFDDFGADAPSEVRTLIAAARCAHGGPDCADAFVAVLNLGVRPAAEWVMTRADAIAGEDPALAIRVMNHVLDLSVQARSPREPIMIMAVRAAERLVALDPEGLRARILDPATPSTVIEAIFVGLVDAANDREWVRATPDPDRIAARRASAAQLASSVRGRLPRRFDSMALVAIARAGAPLSQADIQQLGTIGAGGGRVDEPLQIQAAWFYLKALGRHREALARLSPE